MEIKLPVTVHVSTCVKVSTPFGDASVTVEGPNDADKDGNPEVKVSWDLPGKSLDGSADVEVPLATLLGPATQLAATALEAAGVPGVGVIVSAIRSLVD